MEECESFLSGKRYKTDTQFNRDRRLIQIRGQEIQDTIRHIAAKATEKPRSIEAKAVDSMGDVDLAEAAVSLIEWDTGNPMLGFDRAINSWIIEVCSKRLGVMGLDWIPDVGPFGMRIPRRVDPSRIMWDHRFESPHHPLCGTLIEKKRVPTDEARALFPGYDLVPDKEAMGKSGYGRSGIISQADRDEIGHGYMEDESTTLWYCWYKNDKTSLTKPRETDRIRLKAADRYMTCQSCGLYRSPTQDTLQAMHKLQGPLPEGLQQGCPICGGDVQRIDAKAIDAYDLKYQNGKRLEVVAPYQAFREPVYDEKWPVPSARTYPFAFL